MSAIFAGLAVLGVLIGSVVTGVCMVVCTRRHWPGTARWVRRFRRPDERPSDEAD
jgi:hypothetical protein